MKGELRAFCVGVVTAFALLLTGLCAPARASETVSVERGHEKYIELGFAARRLSIGDTKIADVSLVDGTTLRVLGLAPGRTTFSVWHEGSNQPKIFELSVSPAVSALRQKLSEDRDLSAARLSVVGDKIVLDGEFSDAGSQKDARDLAKFMTGAEVLDLSEIKNGEVVQVDVQFATVNKTTLDALGINFTHLGQQFSLATAAPNTMQQATLIPGGNPGIDLATVAPIAGAFGLLLASPKYNTLSILSALKSTNLAQTLAEPTLVVRSGDKADFLVGGEIPIPVPQGNTSNSITIEYKRFGVSLKVEPTILKNRRIALHIRPEVSELDFTNALVLQGFTIPALRTRETETTIEVANNEPLILAGLMFKTAGKVHEKLPYLSDVPVIGEVFKRAQDTHEEQELIVAVTPHLVTSASQDRSRQESLRGRLSKISVEAEPPPPEEKLP